MSIQFSPLGDRVLVRRHKAAEQSKGGLVIPDNAQQKPMTGHVEAVGPDVLNVCPGVDVYFPAYAGAPIFLRDQDRDEDYIVLSEKELLGLIPIPE